MVDIDPGPATSWTELVRLAQLHETALDHLDVRGYPKVTGQRGIQIWIPIVPGPTFAETRGVGRDPVAYGRAGWSPSW